MNKYAFLIIIVVTIVFTIIFFFFKSKTINSDSEKTLELNYKSNAGVPFKWEFEIVDKDIVSFEKSYITRNDNKGAIAGGAIYTNYVFKGLKKGTTKIIFRYRNITDGNVWKESVNDVKVDDDNNISLIVTKEDQ